MFRTIKGLIGTGLLIGVSMLASADSTVQSRQIVLQGGNGEQLTIGQLLLSPTQDGYSAVVKMDDAPYGDQFLSMRPFKCLESEKQQLCHLPYPYQNKQRIQKDALIDLEYQLLFIRRAPNDYGINPWFGVYYKLEWQNPPEGPIVGTLYETNLDVLAAPPEDPAVKPITADDLYEADHAEHWLPQLIIR